MKRRQFITLLGGAAAWPMAARAQQPAMPVIGFLSEAAPGPYAPYVTGFLRGLNEVGYVEGRNVLIEYRWAEFQYDRLPGLAADLVRRGVRVIFTGGGLTATFTAKAATTTIPIVFYIGSDPVELGLVASLGRPGGNLTGLVSLNAEVVPKRLELLHELLPTATSMALLLDTTGPTRSARQSQVQMAARKLGLQLHVLEANTEREIETAFTTLLQVRASGLVIPPSVFFNTRAEQIAALALRHAVPTVFQYREFTAAGGLMSYGSANITDMFRLSGVYTGRILKGEKPADLPVEQATKVELFINLKTAKTLGLTVPTALLVRADEVIE
jgi:putative tryptophan/tyrosine transport system substrate-binding protein